MHGIKPKPKLVFFQYRYDRRLPVFLLMHAQEQAKCLSEFFDVTVIDYDCDYQEICERYQPDLTIFESGVPFATCRQPKVTNTQVNPQVFKVGLLNADAFGEGRAGFLSDMDHWGIATFFAIATTAAEHNPEIADNLFIWPNSVDTTIYRDYGQPKNIPVLFAGNNSPLYPWRQQVIRLVSRYYPSLICPHPGYSPGKFATRVMVGEPYARMLNASFFVPACGTIAREVIRKHFEIPACRSCLVTQRSAGLESAGFVDMGNCVFAEKADVLDKLEFLFAHPDRLGAITDAGYQLVHSSHTNKQRDQILQWFMLRKTLPPNAKIVQPNPFGPLAVVPEATVAESNRQPAPGSLVALLREGDELFWKGDYSDAEAFYLKCVNYYRWMPEAQLRLALCNLCTGKAKSALFWITKPIQCTLAEYKATDPDPVEWAYFIVTLLCLGRIKDALERAGQFPWLHHTELDRIRLIIRSITNCAAGSNVRERSNRGQRRSIHCLRSQEFQEWTRQLSGILKACGQTSLALKVVECAVHQTVVPVEDSGSASDGPQGLRTLPPKNHKGAANAFKRRALFGKCRVALKQLLKNVLRRVEAKYGNLLPDCLKQRGNDEYFRAIQDLAREETFRTALIIGAAPGKDSTQALLVARASRPGASLFGISVSQRRRIPVDHSFTEWHQLQSSSPESLGAQLDEIIAGICEKHRIDCFDLLVVDGSELGNRLDGTKSVGHQLRNAKSVVLDDVNSQSNHGNYTKLLEDPGFFLVDRNLNRRNGYAIFERTRCDDVDSRERLDIICSEY